MNTTTTVATENSSRGQEEDRIRRGRRREGWLLMVTTILAALARQAQAQCPSNTMTSFERVGGVAVKDAPLAMLYTAPNASSLAGDLGRQLEGGHVLPGVPITAECNNRCRRSAKCRAFLVDYARHTCFSVDVRGPQPVQLVASQERTSYFEKVCLQLPTLDCERAWLFERAPGHQLVGLDDKTLEDVPSRLRCQELCLGERDFRCRSGEYDQFTQQCRLSMADRHTKPNAFRPTGTSVDYFENQCAPVGSQCNDFDRFDELDLGRAEIMRPANTSDQCQQFCTQTVKAFVCRSFTWSPLTGRCYLNSANSLMVGGLDRLLPAPGLVYFQRNDCIDLKLDCDHQAMTLQLRTAEPFRGRMYVRDDPGACEVLGRSSLSSSLSIPFASQAGARCAQREPPNRYSSVVVVQQHPMIQRKTDRYIKLVCDFQTANKTISSHYNVNANPWTSTALINATSFAPKIKLRIADRYGQDIAGAKLGDELYLRIEAETESVYDMVARSVLAKSGNTDESIVLIDKDGCPTDFRIFPALKKLNRRTIVGKFDAFKFSSDVVVRFQVDVQFCLNQCPSSHCDQANLLLNAQPTEALEAAAAATGGATPPPADSSLVLAATPSSPAPSSLQQQQQPQMQMPQPYAPQQRQTNGLPINNFSSFSHSPYASTAAAATNSQSTADTPSYFHPQQQAGGNRMPNAANQASGQDANDPQMFEAQPARKLTADGGVSSNKLAQSGPNGGEEPNRRRRRRSAASESQLNGAPTANGRHVPLQTEVLVFSGSAAGPQKKAGGPGAAAGSQKQARRDGRNEKDREVADWTLNVAKQEPLDSLLCTTRHSLVMAAFAFCLVQLLTLGLCLLVFLQRRRADQKWHLARPLASSLSPAHRKTSMPRLY